MPKEWEKLRLIADAAERRLRQAFIDAVRQSATPELQRKLETAPSRAQANAFQVAAAIWTQATKKLQQLVAKELLDVQKKAWTAAASELGLQKTFDLTNPAAVEFARSRSTEFAQTLNGDTQRALRQVITSSFLEGIPPAQRARLLRESIGLAPKDVSAIANFRRLLRALSKRDSLDGLSETTMDRIRRSDIRLFSKKKDLDAERIQRLTDAYRARLLRERAVTLVRSETMGASNAGQQILWESAIQNKWLPQGKKTMRKFLVTPDDRLCPICRPMAGQIRGMNEDFVSPYNGEQRKTPPMHSRCRCAMGLIFSRNEYKS
jgi:hypothetical protein